MHLIFKTKPPNNDFFFPIILNFQIAIDFALLYLKLHLIHDIIRFLISPGGVTLPGLRQFH
jgi:hypothetical protein